MSYCPKCKYEYEDSITVCPDCNTPLVDVLPEDELTIPIFYDENEEYCKKMIDYLHYNKITDVCLTYVEEKQAYGIFTNTANKDVVHTLLNTFLNTELEDEAKQMPTPPPEPEEVPIGPYIKKADKYKDLVDSAICLIIVGLLGDIYLIGKAAGFINFGPDYTGATAVLFTLVMGALFTAFLVGGILSVSSAKKVKGQISGEEQMTIDIKEKFGTMQAEELDSHYNTNVDEATLYFHRSAYLKSLILADYPNIEEVYLEEMIEQIYTTIFE
jgi:hypothetical protein